MKSAYEQLTRHFARIHRYNHLSAIANWDRHAMMPAGGREARADAEAELATLIHRTRTDGRVGGWIAAAEGESLDDVGRAA